LAFGAQYLELERAVYFFAVFILINYMFLRGELKRNKNGAERGKLVNPLDEHYLSLLFNYSPSPLSAPAVVVMLS
jgi:hypothetical protein